tara:strand:- start:113 stop:1339 length:1227 start_codon:yes stop_codon:yes gene_type:complete
MGEGESTEWPDDDTDPFGTSDEEPAPEEEAPETQEVEQEPQQETLDEQVLEKTDDETPLVVPEQEGWKLPIRAAPLLRQFHDETVTEYPLQQSADGRKTTSLVVDDDLLRIIESRLDDDGQRRLKVSLSMKREITGFKHQHNELMHKHQFLWLSSALLGTLFLLSSITVFNFFGVLLVAAGVWNWSSMHLETHHLEFTNAGGTLSHTLRGYGTNRPFFRASMALLGSEMAGLLRNGELKTEALEQFHAALAAPAPKITPPPVQVEQPPAPMQIPTPPQSIPVEPVAIPAPPQAIPLEAKPMAGPPTAPPTTPLPAPIAPPPVAAPVIPAAPLPPPPALVPPAPASPLPPPPPLNAPGGMPLPPPLGLPDGPIPLDAPLPNAPEIAVKASPVEDTLSEEEQSDLLNELS